MSYVLSLIVAATVLGATQAGSEEVGLGVSVRWVDNGVTVGTSLNRCYDTDWNTAAIKEGESEPPRDDRNYREKSRRPRAPCSDGSLTSNFPPIKAKALVCTENLSSGVVVVKSAKDGV
jgi:hypothetical protein